jgi:tRNA dimethylallyltransferase
VGGLTLDRSVLYGRIDRRVDRMLASGWLDECRGLLACGRPLSREARQALGYRLLFAHLRGELTLAEARERICFATHHFARRQLSWFRRFPGVTWVPAAPEETPEQLADRVAAAWDQQAAEVAHGERGAPGAA